MGQKVNPIGLRIGINKDWQSTWYASKQDFATFIKEDHDIRAYFNKKHANSGVSKVEIERTENKLVINIFTGKPGMIIGQKGAGIETLKKELDKIVDGKQVVINIQEIKHPDLDANVVAQSVAAQIEKRVRVKRAIKSTLQRVMKAGPKGCKILVSGRIDGREIAGSETFSQGSVPLHTLRADIDYGFSEAHTTYGVLGVKVWIYKGEVLQKANSVTTNKQGGDK